MIHFRPILSFLFISDNYFVCVKLIKSFPLISFLYFAKTETVIISVFLYYFFFILLFPSSTKKINNLMVLGKKGIQIEMNKRLINLKNIQLIYKKIISKSK